MPLSVHPFLDEHLRFFGWQRPAWRKGRGPASEARRGWWGRALSSVPSSALEPPGGEWHRMSDSTVTRVDEPTALSSQAFLLFYERFSSA